MWVETGSHRHAEPVRREWVTGRFEIGALVSEGATARVYRGWDLLLGQPAAIKVIRAEILRDPLCVARFRAKAAWVGRLAHPNLMPVLAAGTTHGRPWFATAWASRGSLADQMVKQGRMRTDDAVRCALQVLQGLDFVHGNGAVHGDVQPENILLGDDDVAMLGDFGLASPWCRASLASPPVEERDLASPSRDLFGVGATLFVVLTGQSPVGLRVERIRPAALAALPAEISCVVDRATTFRTEDRYPTARAMAEDLVQRAAPPGRAITPVGRGPMGEIAR